ncbi:usherin-like isoform X1 [Styela clava]
MIIKLLIAKTSYCRWLIVLVLADIVTSQTGSYPPNDNIGLYRPISTNGDTTCGTSAPGSYCQPAADDHGLAGRACNKRRCNLECPGRDRVTDGQLRFINVMDGNLQNCITPNYEDTRGTGKASFDFQNHPTCFAQPTNVLRTGTAPGQFTLAVWIKQRRRNAGVILEKIASPRPGYQRQVVLSVMVGAFSILMQYRGTDGRSHVQLLKAPVSPSRWHHVTLQVYNTTANVFLDGLGEDETPYLSETLDFPIADINYSPIVKIGQRMAEWNDTSEMALYLQENFPEWSNTTGQFVGRLHDYRWYEQALTNREIHEIYSGVFKELNVQSNCLCPMGYPRVHPLKERYCIPNGLPDTTEDRRLRLHEDAHPLGYINDGDYGTFWISSNFYMPGGVTMTIDMENGEYQIFSLIIQFHSPQPQAITFSRLSNKTTEGTWKPWGHFADDCYPRFKMQDNEPLKEPDSFNCMTFPPVDDIPHLNNNVTFNLLSDAPFKRPGKDDFYNNPILMNFVRAEKIRIRMQYQYFTLRPEVAVGHQVYLIREIKIIGRCNCHGHADACDTTKNPYQCRCIPRSNTGGNLCEKCLPLYNNKPFHEGTQTEAFDCQPCECYGHADSCHYDETLDPFPNDFYSGGGGRCDNCKHHTTGINCEKCAEFYFRMEETSLDDSNVCLSCDCHAFGVVNGTMDCEKIGGQCKCKSQVLGRTCGVCNDGYYDLDVSNPEGCKLCQCHLPGTTDRNFKCQQVGGQCSCKVNVKSRTCSECKSGFKNLRDSNSKGCEACNCHQLGAIDQYCNPNTGDCSCKPNVEGMHCDVCENGFWKLTSRGCEPCGCDQSGTVPGTVCNKITGQCKCKANTEGRTCNICKDVYYNLDANNEQGCENCRCDPRGTIDGSLVCDKVTGQCDCKSNVEGRTCNLCKRNTFGLDWSLDEGCQKCNCDLTGTELGDKKAPEELVCDANTGKCTCLTSREGRRCDMCSPGYYIPSDGTHGCYDCNCHSYASTSQICSNTTGQCPCKVDAGITGRMCELCADTFWNFHHLFGSCEPCGCNNKGSINDTCNTITGTCSCKGNVIGDKCDECREGSSYLTAENPMGCYSYPEQQAPPIELNKTSSWIKLEWNAPDLPNGDNLQYRLYRNSELVYSVNDSEPFSTISYNDTYLLPYTNYDYYIETSNMGGIAQSAEVSFRTIAGIPTGVPPLTVKNVRSTSAVFSWQEPSVAHGPIERYVLQSLDTEDFRHPEEHYSGLEMEVEIENLRPFVNYTFIVRACTSGGCGDSMPIIVVTPEDKPKRQPEPTITAISNSTLLIEWGPPEKPNGVIQRYEVLMRGKPDENGIHSPLQRVAFTTIGYYNPRPQPAGAYMPIEEPETNFTMDGLQPFTEYQFLVLSANSIGSTESPWTTGRTLEGSPVFIDKPRAWAVSSSQVNITWQSPDPVTEVRGDVKWYQVLWRKNNINPYAPPTTDVVLFSDPRRLQFLANNLDPYVNYTFLINMCNHVSCVKSDKVTVQTLPAAPEGQNPPTQDREDTNSIFLSWTLPEKVNGPDPRFTLYKSPVSFSTPPTEMRRGIRFPGDSYLKFSPDILPIDESYSGIQLKFRTLQENALLFFAASKPDTDYTRHEYLVLQLRNGRPWFLFDLQNSPTSVTIDNDDINDRYNDGKWHRLEVNRFGQNGYLELDTIWKGSGSTRSPARVYGASEIVYIGGLPAEFNVARPHDRGSMVVVTEGFVGCIKDILVQRNGRLQDWTNVSFSDAIEVHRTYDDWQGCPDVLDMPAVHFLGRGYLQLENPFNMSNADTWSVRMQIRVAFSSGIIFYASGRSKNFMLGTLNNGTLRFIISIAEDDYHEVTLDPSTLPVKISLCDGNWHLIEFRNDNGQLLLTLDDHAEIGPRLNPAYKGIDLRRKFYMGGIEKHLLSGSSYLLKYFDEDGRSFGGCIRNVFINLVEINIISMTKTAYNVDLDGCPIGARNSHVLSGSGGSGEISGLSSGTFLEESDVSLSKHSCEKGSLKVIYEGSGFQFNSSELHPFTQYLYRVMTSNDGGDTRSAWKIMRSGEGIPEVVGSPYDVRHISGYIVEVMWRRPYHSKGVVVNYTLSAKPLEEDLPASNYTIDTVFDGESYSGNITTLQPWGRYEVFLAACTKIGCTSSIAGFSFVTNQEAPQGVQAPTAAVTKISMTLSWHEPNQPNGKITSYTLLHNSTMVYTGNATQHTIDGLATFQQQRFKLEACTKAGCNSSKEVTIYSAQLPPGHVDAPMLSILGPNAIELRWLEPAILNGIFQRYVVYLSKVKGDLGDVVYNSTEPSLECELHELLAGMEYFITLKACTGGGCKQSTSSPIRTTESVPEDIPAPTVISRSPFSFDVTWHEPKKPNGIIKNYTLYFDYEPRYTTKEPSARHIEKLTPYSRHYFRVQACTVQGCAFSTLIENRTMESKPEGKVVVSVTIVNSREIDTKWNMPVRQNGIMNYSVSCTGLFFKNHAKRDFREVHEKRILHIGGKADQWIRIEGLLPYTDYVVQVNASNSKGFVISNMRTVSMPPGAPDGVENPDLLPTSPYEIVATWKDPARNNAPGNAYFQLQYRRVTPLENEKDAFSKRTRQMSFTLRDLKPYEEYEFLLIAINSFGSTSSEWTRIHTQQTSPQFVAKPYVYDILPWSLSLKWKPPAVPNGVVQNYTIYETDEMIVSLPNNITHYIAENLQPFNWYKYVVEACTEGGCRKSDVASVQTAATAPEGLLPPEARSESPTSIFLTWKPPVKLNGILDNYILERKLHNVSTFNDSVFEASVLGSFVPTQSLRYLDDADLLPYTTYQYRITSSTIGGKSITSNWTSVTTRPGRPGGVPQPSVTILSARSVLVEWKSPPTTNGPVIRYEVLFPDPQYVVNDTETLNLTVDDLIPYTDYQVSVLACTDGGCSESFKTDITTFTTVPDQLDLPIATPISESYIAVQWKPPKYPNGPGIFYELTRTKLSQPLAEPVPGDINIPLTIYKGTELSYQDRELERFTTLSYVLSCFNVDGSVVSNATNVTTLGGIPLRSPIPEATVHNHTSIFVTWTQPSIFDIQGEVSLYFIRYEPDNGMEKNFVLEPDELSATLPNLHPGTNYSIVLTTFNGAHNISSDSIFIKTKDGAPESVYPPVVYSLSASELHASWLEPEHPNGEITEYSIIIDDVKIPMTSKHPSSYILNNLQPFTVYNLQMEACTKYACARSKKNQATTQETLPMGIDKPLIKILSSNKIELKWIPPEKSNGILRSYEVRRRSLLPCNQMESEKNDRICSYVKCEKNEKSCGSSCYSPSTKVCCEGQLYFRSAGFECCSMKYIKAKVNATDVCCSGRYFPFMRNYKCCGKRYVKVLSGEVCCEDSNEDRVSVGAGDSCCSVVPFYSNGIQICCNNKLHDGFKKKCCGKEVVNADFICCGSEDDAKVFQKKINHKCCGNEYISTHTSLCCKDSNSEQEMVHSFDDMNSETRQKKCCSTQLISADMKCCNGRGYDSNIHVCADVGTIAPTSGLLRCGSGSICSINQAPGAFCDRCDFDLNAYDCFISKEISSENSLPENVGSMCATSYITVYTGTPEKLSFTDDAVDAFTRYEYKVIVSNKMGSTDSESVAITTFESIPEEVSPPQWTSNNQDTILLSWKSPKKPNGVITKYALMRDGLEIWTGLAFKHTDSFQILPFRRYSYVVKACTYVGCGSSPPAEATSIQGVPNKIQSPLLNVLSPNIISITWAPPTEANGLITKYTLNETDIGTIYTIDPVVEDSVLSYQHENLEPYSKHTYVLTACTIAGCTTSDEVSATTSETKPEGVWKYPASLVIDMSTVELFWTVPEKPNGVIREYRLMRQKVSKGKDSNNIQQMQFIYQGGPQQLNYTDSTLQSGSIYDYELIAINGAGFGKSNLHQVKMPESIPHVLPKLDIRVTGSNTLFAEWSLNPDEFPAKYRYSIIIRKDDMHSDHHSKGGGHRRSKRSVNDDGDSANDDDDDKPLLMYSAGHNNTYVIEKLAPYTLYRVRVRTCLPEDEDDVNCVTGDEKLVRTLPAPPEEQSPPVLKAVGPRVIDVSWKPPEKPNGILTKYEIYRRDTSQNSHEKIVFSTGDIQRNWFTDSDVELLPYTRYEYRVRVSNNEGVADSSWADITTLEDKPHGIKSPTVSAISAYAVRVIWEAPERPNGNIVSYSLEYRDEPNDPTMSRHLEKAVTVPSTLRETHISGLKPFTGYEVRLVVTNGAGMEARSDWVSVRTSAAAPNNVGNFSVTRMEDGQSLMLTWDPPAITNGEIMIYNIYEYGDDKPLQSQLFRQYHLRRLKPFTNYTLLLEACTGHDLCTTSPPQTFTTAETAPDMQPAPSVTLANTTAITLFWTRPKELNGILTSYKVIRNEIPRSYYQSSFRRERRSLNLNKGYYYLMDDDQWMNEEDSILHGYSSYSTLHRVRRAIGDNKNEEDDVNVIHQIDNPTQNSYNYTDVNLKPFTKYEYKIRSSTNAGFVDSEWVTAETHQSSPSGLAAPIIEYTLDHKPTKLIVKWSLPEELNGILQTFRVQRNSSIPLSFPTTQFQFTDTDLQPYSLYSYSVTACTAGGCVESPISVKRTLEEAPSFVSPPLVVSINSTALHVEWSQPTITNGVIQRYQVYVDERLKFEGLAMETLVGQLMPYTLYSVSVAACTSSGCRRSDNIVARTSEAAPEIMSQPELHVTSPHSIEVNWEAPIKSNGKIIRYELRRNNELIFVTDGQLKRYHDFGLSPGTTYTYYVTAYNKRGSVKSDIVTEMTDPAAPAGLQPPVLKSVSSSSIHAVWEAPTSPNGIIVNYTLYVRHANNKNDKKIIKLPGNIYEHTVRGLLFYEDYSFWLQSCTQLGCVMSERTQQKTKEGVPSGQLPPSVSLDKPDDVILHISWDSPHKPNGLINLYKLYRRQIIETASSIETVKGTIVYNGTERSFSDSNLTPYTKYQYKVSAHNAAGDVTSDWSSLTRTGEAIPAQMPAPTFGRITERSIQVLASQPVIPNGVIRTYTMYARRNMSSDRFREMTTGYGPDQTAVGLIPYTSYEFQVKACTLKHLCLMSPSAYVTTMPAAPRGQNPPQAINISSKNITLQWSSPIESNGIINSYEVHMRMSCSPYQPLQEECHKGPATISYVGVAQQTTIDKLSPYQSYEFCVVSVNDYGRSKSEWTTATTLKSAPKYVAPISVTSNISSIYVEWHNSFKLNGILMQYELSDHGRNVYSGIYTAHTMKRTAAMVHKFQVKVTTDSGIATSAPIMHDTGKGTSYIPEPPDGNNAEKPNITSAAVPVYETIWFIAVVALISIMLIFTILAVVLRRISGRYDDPLKSGLPPNVPSHHLFSNDSSNNDSLERVQKNVSHRSFPISSDHSVLQDTRFTDANQFQNPAFTQDWSAGFNNSVNDNSSQKEFGTRKEKIAFVDTHL